MKALTRQMKLFWGLYMEVEALGITLLEMNGSYMKSEWRWHLTAKKKIKDYFHFNERTTLYVKRRTLDLLLCWSQRKNSQNAFYMRMHVRCFFFCDKTKGKSDILWKCWWSSDSKSTSRYSRAQKEIADRSLFRFPHGTFL